MTPDQAADLAARTLAAIDAEPAGDFRGADGRRRNADRERVASDLAGWQEAYRWRDGGSVHHNHAARYAAGLRRTAALYGVAERPTDGGSPVACGCDNPKAHL